MHKISFIVWHRLEYEAIKLQYFYVWTCNDIQEGNETNALASYMAYDSMNTLSVKPKFSKNEISFIKSIINKKIMTLSPKYKNSIIVSNKSKLPAKRIPKILIKSRYWNTLILMINSLLSIYINYYFSHKMNKSLINHLKLTTLPDCLDNINSYNDRYYHFNILANSYNDTLDRVLSGQNLYGQKWSIVNENDLERKHRNPPKNIN